MKKVVSNLLVMVTAFYSPTINAEAAVPENLLSRRTALSRIVERTRALKSQGQNPIALFDIDDTLVSTRERTLRILKEFASQAEIQKNFKGEVQKISKLKEADINYEMSVTLKKAGIENAKLQDLVGKFWSERFFTNNYCRLDQAIAGSAEYLHQLVQAGAKIVYLTGRDAPSMLLGTQANLKRNHFPDHPSQTLLMLKPNKQMNDLTFKSMVFSQIEKMGEVVGVFENEPANLNAMAKAFPKATAVFLDTSHSPKPDIPAAGSVWITDYQASYSGPDQCAAAF